MFSGSLGTAEGQKSALALGRPLRPLGDQAGGAPASPPPPPPLHGRGCL